MCGTGMPEVSLIVQTMVAGYPARSLKGECWVEHRPSARPRTIGPLPHIFVASSFDYVSAFPVKHAVFAGSPGFDVMDTMPCGPVWPGFAINTAFYAAVLWVLMAFPFAIRRTIRRRRGLCPACAYPVG